MSRLRGSNLMVRSLPVKTLGHKASHYLEELRLCFRAGANVRSRITLASDTLLFHLANGLARKWGSDPVRPKRRRIFLGAQPRDLWLRTYGGDLFIFHEVFLDDCYHIPTAWVPNVRTVVDLGANIGLTTLYFAKSYPQARFICIEPDPNNASVLRRNVSWLKDRVC